MEAVHHLVQAAEPRLIVSPHASLKSNSPVLRCRWRRAQSPSAARHIGTACWKRWRWVTDPSSYWGCGCLREALSPGRLHGTRQAVLVARRGLPPLPCTCPFFPAPVAGKGVCKRAGLEAEDSQEVRRRSAGARSQFCLAQPECILPLGCPWCRRPSWVCGLRICAP